MKKKKKNKKMGLWAVAHREWLDAAKLTRSMHVNDIRHLKTDIDLSKQKLKVMEKQLKASNALIKEGEKEAKQYG